MRHWGGPCLLLLLAVRPLSAQQDSTLKVAVRLVTEGQGDSARALVRAKLAATASTDSTYSEVLYTAGVVAANADSALAYFRRTSVEYSQSAWADRALLRIAQLAFASGDLNTAFRSAERVLADYPFSTVRAQAAYWAGRSQLDLGNLALACRHLTQAADSAGDDVELSNRARFYVQRCAAMPLAAIDTARRDTTVVAPAPGAPPALTPPALPAPSFFTVQIAAVRSAGSADQTMQALKRAGYDPRVVRDADGFLKVRVGRFKTRTEAQRMAAEIRRKIGGTPFVTGEQ